MKFDICLMNPPYGSSVTGGMYLDMQFTTKCNKICNNVISVQPANRIISKTKLGDEMASLGNLKELYIYNGNDIFNIATSWKYIGIYVYDNSKKFDNILCIDNINNVKTKVKLDRISRNEFFNTINFKKGIIDIIHTKKSLYDELLNKNRTMVNDGDGFIYEENRLQRGKNKCGIVKKDQKSLSRVREYLKSGEYKYCLYKGSYNNDYDEVQEWKGEDVDKLFKGQICWLTNKENIKNNIRYWMECPLFDLWRKFYLIGNGVSCCNYCVLPALKFDISEINFKEYVDSLNNFTEEEIKTLEDFKVHNIQNYK